MEYCLGDRLELYSASSVFFLLWAMILIDVRDNSFVDCIINWHIERNELVDNPCGS